MLISDHVDLEPAVSIHSSLWLGALAHKSGRPHRLSRPSWLAYNNNNNNSKTTFMVLSSWQSHCKSSPGSFDECRTAPSGRRPKTKPAARVYALQAARVYTHHHHLLLLLSPKADTHFTVPRRVGGWLDIVGWLHTEMVYPPTDGHPSWY